MNSFKKHYLLITTISGALIGYLFLHPFANILYNFFHRHEEGHLHLHWGEILVTFLSAYDLKYWPHALSYVIISGIIGYFFGKTIAAYRTINEQLERFSEIGINASGIIHDLSNPLTGIIGHAQLIKSEVDNPQLISECEVIEKESRRLSKMIMDIKMIAQGTEAVKLSKTPTDLGSFLENLISKMALHRQVKIDSRFEGPVSIDRDYFERVLWNLIKNADEALEVTEDGRIEISINESNNSVIICISDNGPGIPKKILKNLFKLGQTFGKRGGSGIGLYNCKRIVEAHGGKIWLTSEVGKGTKVYIKIPK